MYVTKAEMLFTLRPLIDEKIILIIVYKLPGVDLLCDK